MSPDIIKTPSLPAKISIITPSYNQARFLERTIQSILAQDHANIEYIVIDGSSTDGSVDIIRRYEDHLAYWVSEKDDGQADAINKGFSVSTGQYLTWLNSDDILYPSSIRKMVEYLEANPQFDFAYGDVDLGFDERNTSTLKGRSMSFEDMLKTLEVPIPQQGCVWRRSVSDKIGGLNPKWHVVLDREFFLRVAERYNVSYLPGSIGFFRYHPDSKSIAQQARWLEELPPMYDEFFSRPDIGRNVIALRRETFGMVYLQCAAIAFRNNFYSRMAAYLWKALGTDPWFPFRKGVRLMIARFLGRILH